jgi:hypothetical protein
MKKIIAMILGSMFLFSIVFAMNKGKDHITLDGGKRGVVEFPHRLHQDKLADDCNACHQLFPKKIGIIKQMISEGKLDSKQVMNKHCIKCHKQLRRKNKPHGPTSCRQCHNK